ncbi:hypothetical protein DEFDS_P259 (plasmid) [Deferribacter desulfuricans SSM1]|uniref:3'-5' exonuclease domain-containing protein n=1 Tax=Deferribacter desulfuricans (strain DSM 14783 / JCM 11476 / NBRC 101012 / SSM1) TaxID=639282 RepID=D3PF87_DEFDS|nr:hypothetical protein [Deferribacter desulfuricans]BAI81879.1 hypothetical protein DEFDS_P259 [Deferribacter desulfuricans SSM1]
MLTKTFKLTFADETYKVHYGLLDDIDYVTTIINELKGKDNSLIFMDLETTFGDNNENIIVLNKAKELDNKPILMQLKLPKSDKVFLVDFTRYFNYCTEQQQQQLIKFLQQYSIDTDNIEKKLLYTKGNFYNFRKLLDLFIKQNNQLVFHNGISFDIRVLYDFYSIFHKDFSDLLSYIKDNLLIDTMKIYKDKLQEPGEKKSNLKYLVKKYINYDLDKTYQKYDWTIRPIDKNALVYAAFDVIFLEKIYDKMMEEIKIKNEQRNQAVNNMDLKEMLMQHRMITEQINNLIEQIKPLEEQQKQIEKQIQDYMEVNQTEEVDTDFAVVTYKKTLRSKRIVDINNLVSKYINSKEQIDMLMKEVNLSLKKVEEFIKQNVLPEDVLQDQDVIKKVIEESASPKLKIKFKEPEPSADSNAESLTIL